MAQNKWEADKTLDQYIHDYFVKRNLHESAKAFLDEAKVSTKPPVAIDVPGGFLYEWWSIFSDVYIARNHGKHSDPMAAYSEAQQIKAREHQQHIQMQQRGVQLQHRDPNIPSLGSPISAMDSVGMPGQPSANALAMKFYEERMNISQSMNSVASNSIINAKNMAHLKSVANQQSPLPHGNTVCMNVALQKMQFGNQQTNDTEGNPSGTHRPSPIDHSSAHSQVTRSSSGLRVAGLNQGVAKLPLKGWPLTNQMQGDDQLQSHSGAQLQRTNNVHNQTQFILAHSQAHGSHGNSTNYVDTDPNSFGCLPSVGSSAKNGQPTTHDRSLCSPIQSSSPKMNIEHVQKSSSQQQDHPQQQSQQNNNKRKRQSSSRPANSTGTGNTAGPSPRSPPSTHASGDGAAMMLNNQHANLTEDTKMNDIEGTPGPLPSYGHLDDINNLEDLDDNIESFLIDEGGDGKDSDNTIKPSTTELKKDSSNGFSFAKVRCIRTENTKITCCHFSSDGNILAIAGHDKKVILWNVETLQTESPTGFHQSVITDSIPPKYITAGYSFNG
uniref:LisH domain-containing protein n=1 Tax=Kalanchoe fedtschenkoi TaxID=63787 RepID=A0A7N0ZVL3_KALFE